MIIVSQDRDGIINFKEITAIRLMTNLENNERNIIAIDTVATERYNIAKYKTEERAKEVLEGITRAYERAGNIMFETDGDERLMKLTHNSNVFEMPKE